MLRFGPLPISSHKERDLVCATKKLYDIIYNDYPQCVLIYIPVRCTFGFMALLFLQKLSGLCPFNAELTLYYLLKVQSTVTICSSYHTNKSKVQSTAIYYLKL